VSPAEPAGVVAERWYPGTFRLLLSLPTEAATAPDAERDAAVRGVAGLLRGDHAEQ
jgi:hypothetical protein